MRKSRLGKCWISFPSVHAKLVIGSDNWLRALGGDAESTAVVRDMLREMALDRYACEYSMATVPFQIHH